MKWIFISCLFLCGCGNLLNSVTRQTEIQETRHDASKATAQGSVEIAYPQGSSYSVSASGNAIVNLSPDAGGRVTAAKNERKTASEKTDQSFSFDEFFKSVPEWAWPCIIFGLIGLILAYILWTKTTMAGKASDAGLAGGISMTLKGITSLTELLEDMSPDDPGYKAIRRERDKLKDLQATLLAKQRPPK